MIADSTYLNSSTGHCTRDFAFLTFERQEISFTPRTRKKIEKKCWHCATCWNMVTCIFSILSLLTLGKCHVQAIADESFLFSSICHQMSWFTLRHWNIVSSAIALITIIKLQKYFTEYLVHEIIDFIDLDLYDADLSGSELNAGHNFELYFG